MAREDLIAALKNAVDRKEPLDSAKETLITAGYGIEEVEDAAKEVEMPSTLMQKAPSPLSNFSLTPSKILKKAPAPQKTGEESKKAMKWVIPIVIIIIVLLILGILYNYIIKA